METARLILDLILILLGLYLVLLKSFFSEKGKNLATKQDIEEITKKIETVKNEIGINSQRRLEYLNDKKMTALNFLSSVSVWLDFTLRPLDRLYNNTLNKDVLTEIIIDLKNKGAEATSNYWKIAVYYENETFNEVVDELYHTCIDLHNFTNQFVINVERKAVQVNDTTERLNKTKDREYAMELKNEIETLHDETNKLVDEYVKNKEGLEVKALEKRLAYIIVLNRTLKIKIPTNH